MMARPRRPILRKKCDASFMPKPLTARTNQSRISSGGIGVANARAISGQDSRAASNLAPFVV